MTTESQVWAPVIPQEDKGIKSGFRWSSAFPQSWLGQ